MVVVGNDMMWSFWHISVGDSRSRTLGSAMPLEAENYLPFRGKKSLGVLLCSDRDGTSGLGTPSEHADKTVPC